MIRQVSLDSYKDITTDGTEHTQRIRILNHIRKYADGLSRNDISRELGITINATTGRVNSLLKEGLVIESGTKVDNVTGKKNLVLKA